MDQKELLEIIEKLRTLARLRDDLLVCYRMEKRPPEKLLNQLAKFNQFERMLNQRKEICS